MSKYYKNIKKSILETWNRDSFIILVEQRNQKKQTIWQKVFRKEIIPKFDGWENLSVSEIIDLTEEIGSEWEISEYFYVKDYLHFLDNIVDEKDFKK